ncbi:hypothetical protein C0995_009359 [Termitomyces sp. Mi166|nr:hypothetical protein C0995_009359 [Termitomyces sp. Mi166\
MAKVDRANYIRHPSPPYEDSPQFVFPYITDRPWRNHQRATYGSSLSYFPPLLPLTCTKHAYAASHILPYLRPGARTLDVGSGSGYLAAVFHHLVGPTGTVVGIEHVDELAKWSIENLRKDGLGEAVDEGRIVIVTGDGRQGPYDAIHVGAAAPITPPKLLEQLASPGRMFIPVGTYFQNIMHVDKDKDGKVTETEVMGVSYVPLTDLEKQNATAW